MKKLLFVCVVLCAVTMAMALSAFSKTFKENYKVKEGSNLDKAACSVCHLSAKGGKLNSYGKDIQAAMKKDNAKKLTAEILVKVEGLDSNKNGVKNIDEIKKDQNPGAVVAEK